MIDWQHVRELRDAIGAEEFAEVVELFLDEISEAIGPLRENPDPSTFEQDLHFLKGTALNLGFRDLGNLCQTSETLAAEGAHNDVSLAPILACYDASRVAFVTKMDQGLAV